jgi:hypothetical protein
MTQKACLELLEKKKKLLNFDYFMQNFTIHIMSIFIRSLNPSVIMVRHDYFLTLMIVKILKYFCEEHNQDFQRIFFIKEEEDGIVLHYNPKQYDMNLEEEVIVFMEENNKEDYTKLLDFIGDDREDENYDEEEEDNIKNRKPNPDSECINLHEVTRSEENLKEIQKNKASVFEYMLSILGKIILLSEWTDPKTTKDLEDYYYDLYFVILEFLIETIQGTRPENLQTVFQKDNQGRHLFGTFLLDIHRLILEENEDELSYQ